MISSRCQLECEMNFFKPLVVNTLFGKFALAHNGEIVNQRILMQRILQHGVGLTSQTDRFMLHVLQFASNNNSNEHSEVIMQMLCSPPPPPHSEHLHGIDWVARIKVRTHLFFFSFSFFFMFFGTRC